MADWLKQYTAALEARDVREQAHKSYIDAYTTLADRSSAQQKTALNTPAVQDPPDTKARTDAESSVLVQELRSTRADLVATQKARATLTASLKDMETQLAQLQAERQQNQAQISTLSKAKVDTERKLKDRDDELRGKARLVEQAQDEMVALGLQLHISEEKSEKLAKENKDLVDRWMKRKEAEADQVNRDSRWS